MKRVWCVDAHLGEGVSPLSSDLIRCAVWIDVIIEHSSFSRDQGGVIVHHASKDRLWREGVELEWGYGLVIILIDAYPVISWQSRGKGGCRQSSPQIGI